MAIKITQKKISLKAGGARRDALKSIFVLGACSGIGFLFYQWSLSEANIISIYILGILLISSITSGWIYGTGSSIVGVLLFNCLYAEPRFTLFFYDWQYSITTLMMLVASLATNYIMTLFREKLDREIQEASRLDILLETSQHLQQADDADGIVDVTLARLYQMFERTILFFPVAEGRVEAPKIKSPEKDFRFSPEDWKLDEEAWARFIHLGSEAKKTQIPVHGDRKAVLFRVRSKDRKSVV